MNTQVTSGNFSLNVKDLLKGLLMAAIVPALTIIQQSVTAGELVFNWKSILIASIAGGVGYLLKNLFTPAQIVITDPPKAVVDAVKEGEATVKLEKA